MTTIAKSLMVIDDSAAMRKIIIRMFRMTNLDVEQSSEPDQKIKASKN